MVVPASMAMVRVRCCGFEIFYFLAGFFLFFFLSTLSFLLLLPTVLSFPFLLPLLRDTDFSTSYPGPEYLSRCAPRGTKKFMSHSSRVSRICIQKGPTLPAASRASLGEIDLTISFFLWVLDCRDARCMQYCNWQLIS